MNAIRSVFSAFANLAGSVNALARVIDQTTARLQQQLTFEPEGDGRQVLEHQPVAPAIAEAQVEGPASNGRGRNRSAKAV